LTFYFKYIYLPSTFKAQGKQHLGFHGAPNPTTVTDRHFKLQFTRANVQVPTAKDFILFSGSWAPLSSPPPSLGRLNVLLFVCRKVLGSLSMKPFSYDRTVGGGKEGENPKGTENSLATEGRLVIV
jgi:hypothetical protein